MTLSADISEPIPEQQTVIDSVLAMTPRELYDLSHEERQKLWSAVWGNSSELREPHARLRLRMEIDRFEERLSDLLSASGNSDSLESEDMRHAENVRGFFERLLGLFGRYKKDFSHGELERFEETLRQSCNQNRIYEGAIDRASGILLASFAWKDNPDFALTADEICIGIARTHNYANSERDWPARFFGDYASGTIDFSTFQQRLQSHITEKERNLCEMRKNMVDTALKVARIVRSGQPYDETEFYISPFDELPYEEILQTHNQLLRYRNILALDEATLRIQLEPLICLYRGDRAE